MDRTIKDSERTRPDNTDACETAPEHKLPPPPTTATPVSLDEALAQLPEAGSDFLDFHLLSELGRGAFGRVYLAQQGDLANRLVALKIAADIFGEPQMLAQLQHTNIVPIYSVHRAGLLQAVCMPYFGPTTLADVLKDVQRQSGPPTSGAVLVSMLQTTILATQELPAQLQSRPAGNARGLVRMLQTMSYVQAVLWIGGRLADGLAHAHERGILHRDLKPANILLSDDGQPMLLDFNLSEDVKLRPQGVLARLGGTLPYMAPEHLEAFQGGRRPVDARSDIYSLGVLLYELLTGRLPFAVPPGQPPEVLPAVLAERQRPGPALRPWNRDATPAVEAIVRRCLDPDPVRRYQEAQELREDLQRQLEDRPLLHAPEPSLRERVRKWARRHPRLASPLSLGMLVVLTLALIILPSAWYSWEAWHEARQEADREKQLAVDRQHLASLQEELARQRSKEAEQRQQQAELHRHTLAARNKLRRFRQEAVTLRGLENRLNPVRLLFKESLLTPAELAQAAALCRGALAPYRVLQDPNWQTGPLVSHLAPDEQAHLRDDVADILCLLARTEAYQLSHSSVLACAVLPSLQPALLAAVAETAGLAESRSPLHSLQLARNCYAGHPVPQLLPGHLATIQEMLGQETTAALAQAWGQESIRPAGGAAGSPTDDRDLCWAAVRHVVAGRFEEAVPLLREATQRVPQHAGGWLMLGECYRQLGEYEQARVCYSACLALEPEFSWVRIHRGHIAFENLHDWEAARRDFDQVVQEQPDWAPAYVHRAAVWAKSGRYAEAIEDCGKALELQPEDAEVYFMRATFRRLMGDQPGADSDLQKVIDITPSTAVDWTYRGLARPAHSVAAALGDFGQALQVDPNCRLALSCKARLLADMQNNPVEAVRVLDRLVALEPDFQDAQFRRGLLLARAGGGGRIQADADARAILQRARTPARLYQAACIYAQSSPWDPADCRQAVELLKEATRGGYGLDRIPSDPELAPLRNTHEFQALRLAAEILTPGEAGGARRR